MLEFNPELLKTDVICVKLVNEYVLAGIGNFLNIYALGSSLFIVRVEIFDGTKICGFAPNKYENQLLIHGETKAKIISFDVPHKNIAVISECNRTLSWILAVKWIADDSKIVTVSMDNTASVWNLQFEHLKKITCQERCIAYCAYIVYLKHKWEELLFLTGTVSSDLLIWGTTNERNEFSCVRRLSGHKGVLFSISYNEINNLICTTSDDRSTIVWKVRSDSLSSALINDDLIEKKLTLHGHSSRIFTCHLTEHFILSAGEDGLVSIWNLDGILLRKIDGHQGANIWSVFCSEEKNIVISGGSDSSVNLFSINMNVVAKTMPCTKNEFDTLKNMAFMNGQKIIVISENGNLYLFDLQKENINDYCFIEQLHCMKSYAILEVSPCKEFCAIGGYHGEIIIYHKLSDSELRQLVSYKIPYEPRIFSIHWFSQNKLITCVDNGFLLIWNLNEGRLVLDDAKQLPPSKERFSTCACLLKDDLFAVGDRKGNIYLYKENLSGPTQSLKKAHNFMGVTNLYYKRNVLISLGKDSTLREYILDSNQNLQQISSDKLPFSWITFYYSISEIRILLTGFKGDNIVIFDYTNRRILFEAKCGGGHRSCDIHCNDNVILLAYIKGNSIHSREIPLHDLLPRVLETSYHGREINTLTSIKYENRYILLSGGEDTTFRVHELNIYNNLEEIFTSKSHLSSIRTICSYMIDKNRFYIFSGGGRAQIIFWELLIQDGKTFCFQKYSYYSALETNEAENRIMDICAYKFGNICHIFAACSDGNVKVFQVQNYKEVKLEFMGNIFCDIRCILKVTICKVVVNHYLLTMATDGLLVFWDINYIAYQSWNTNVLPPLKIEKIKSHQSFNSGHSSGINSFFYSHFKVNRIVFATGGDDNTICLNLLGFQSDQKIWCESILSNRSTHCAQVTGVFVFDGILITTSIDQKIIAYEWDGAVVTLSSWVRYKSSVADIQGMRVINFNDNNPYPTKGISLHYPLKIVVYGKGIEILTLFRGAF